MVSGSTLLSPAAAAEASCDAPARLTAAITRAQTDLAQARLDVQAVNCPLGRLVAAKRREAKVDLTTSRAQLEAPRTRLAHTKAP